MVIIVMTTHFVRIRTMTMYTKNQKSLEKYFYVVNKRGDIVLPPGKTSRKPETTSLFEGEELTTQQRDKRVALLSAFYANPLTELEELSPFSEGCLIADPLEVGVLSAPSPKKTYELSPLRVLSSNSDDSEE